MINEIELTFWLAVQLGAGLCLGWIAVSMTWAAIIFIFHKPLLAFAEWWSAE